jgi:hypothetical protein
MLTRRRRLRQPLVTDIGHQILPPLAPPPPLPAGSTVKAPVAVAPGATAAPPPPAPPAGNITVPGIVDNFYENLLKNNPLYSQQLANLSAAGTIADSQRRQAIQKLLADFGYIPEGYNDQYGDVNDLVRGLAGANTSAGLSTYAQLGRERDTQARNVKNDLAARGMLSSGETGYQLGQNEREYMQNLTDSERQLLDQLTGFAGQYTGAVSDIATQKTDAAQNAMQEILATNPNAPNDRAGLLKDTVNKKGVGWYSLGGKLYDSSGQALDIPALLAAARQRRQEYLASHTHSQFRGTLAWRRLQALRAASQPV